MDKFDVQLVANELITIQDILRWCTSCFNSADIYLGHGTDNVWDEAINLVLPTLNLPLDLPIELYHSRLLLSERVEIIKRVQRRVEDRIPVAYLTNKAWFCGHEFYVNEHVLIPRSPIGELINKHFAGTFLREPIHILDMCTGSGCIAIACAYEFPEAEVDAVDISEEALAIAEYNIEQHGLQHQVTPILSDLFDDLPLIKYSVIVANPPYVDAEDMANLPKEFIYEPKLGLEAGDDGLLLVRRILKNAADYLENGGVLICEVGNSMVHVAETWAEVPFTWINFEFGGDGVFMLTREQLVEYQSVFQNS